MTDATCDVAVVGAGILGLATAWRLLEARPDLTVTVVDKEERVAVHQSGHNSGVLHAGVYYPPGSRKARLCRRGKEQLQRWCDERGVAYALTGKVIVAVEPAELPRLAELEDRARANGVPGLARLDRDGLRAVEPHVTGIAGLHSPTTGVIDFGAVCERLAAELEAAGAQLRMGAEVLDLIGDADGVVAVTTAGEVRARVVIACAGLQSDRLAAMTGDAGGERIVPFRGSWLLADPPLRTRVHGNVYPVPAPRLPFLGVHLTRRLDGQLWIGPNAVLALDREGYERPALDRHDLAATARWPGTWRLAAAHWRTGAREVAEDLLLRLYLRRVRRYLPEVTTARVRRGPTGIRAQSVTRHGELVDDFRLDAGRRVIHVRNAPSPAATASLAIGEVLRDEVLVRLP